MKDCQDKQELIDRYLLGDMNENASAAFEKQLSGDTELREETELTRHIIAAIWKESEQAALETMKTIPEETIRKWIPSPRPATGFNRRSAIYICISAAAAAGILFVLYFGFGPRYSTEQLFTQYYQVRPYETYPVRGGFDLTPDERMWMRQAETYYRQADYASALLLYNRLFDQKPDLKTLPEEAVFFAAICRLETNELPGAIELLEYIASGDTFDFRDDAARNLAFAFLKDGQRNKAIKCLEQLIEMEDVYAGKALELRNKLKEKKWF